MCVYELSPIDSGPYTSRYTLGASAGVTQGGRSTQELFVFPPPLFCGGCLSLFLWFARPFPLSIVNCWAGCEKKSDRMTSPRFEVTSQPSEIFEVFQLRRYLRDVSRASKLFAVETKGASHGCVRGCVYVCVLVGSREVKFRGDAWVGCRAARVFPADFG